MKTSCTPTSIVVPHRGLGNVRARKIGNCLKVMQNVKEINIENNRLDAQSLVSVFSNMNAKHGIQKLYAGHNKVNHHTIKALAIHIRDMTSLTVLHLQSTGMQCRQVKLLCHTLCDNSSITDLNLSRNEIGIKGGIALGEMLQQNDTLRMLDLSWNCIRIRAIELCGSRNQH